MFGESGGMGVGMWLFWILLIVIVVLLVRGVAGAGSSTGSQESPLEILKARYARGEIDEEEYHRRRKELEH